MSVRGLVQWTVVRGELRRHLADRIIATEFMEPLTNPAGVRDDLQVFIFGLPWHEDSAMPTGCPSSAQLQDVSRVL